MTWYEGATRAERLRVALSARSLDALLRSPGKRRLTSPHFNYIGLALAHSRAFLGRGEHTGDLPW